jgi:ERCC4-type nuclease
VPTARAAGADELQITIDSRERYPYKFAGRRVTTQRAELAAGDYAVLAADRVVAAVERKSFEDLVKSLIDGTLGFQLADLAALPSAAVVVEERYAAVAAAPRVTPGWPCELVAQLQVRYASVPIVFADSRKLAEDWTHRFLAAAAAHHCSAAG